MISKELPLPHPGHIEHMPGFVDTDAMDGVNASFDNISQGVHYVGLYHDLEDWRPQASLRQLNVGQELAVHALAKKVVPHATFEWETYSVYVRRMGNPGIASLSRHKDGERDIRVLIEGHESRWHFDDPEYVARYPEGLALSAGDTVVLSNLCHPDQQLMHGVAIGRQQAIRLSYLFHFYHRSYYTGADSE